MLLLIPIVLMTGTGALLAVLRAVRPQFRFGWLTAMGAASASWLIILFWQPQLPLSAVLPLWSFAELPPTLPAFSAMDLTWPHALSLATLLLAVLLTNPVNQDSPRPSRWSLSLTLTGLSLLATLADGPLTLAWCWAGTDLAELAVILRHKVGGEMARRALAMFSVRLAGVGVVLLALAASGAGASASFHAIPQPQAILLPAAVLLRLLAFAAPWPSSAEPHLWGGIGTTMQLSASVGSIAFLSRVDLTISTTPTVPVLLVLCIASAIYAGWVWLRSPGDFVARPMWSLCLGSLAVASTLRGYPAGTTGWGISLLLAGTMFLLSNDQPRWLKSTMWVGAWLISALPLSITASGLMSGRSASTWSLFPILLAQAMLVAGYVYLILRPASRNKSDGAPAWLQTIQAVGIGFPLAVGMLLGFSGWQGAMHVGVLAAAAPVTGLALGLVWAKTRIPIMNPTSTQWFHPVIVRGSNRLRLVFSRLYQGVQGLSDSITQTLEGESGIMWSLLLLALFVSLIVGRNP